MPDQDASEARFINAPGLENPTGYSDYRRARDRFLGSVGCAAAPAITPVEASRLFADGLLIGIEGIAAA